MVVAHELIDSLASAIDRMSQDSMIVHPSFHLLQTRCNLTRAAKLYLVVTSYGAAARRQTQALGCLQLHAPDRFTTVVVETMPLEFGHD